MSHLPADIHRRLEGKPRPELCVFVNGKIHLLDAVEGDVMPRIGEDVLIHLARQDEWVKHTVVGFYAWPGIQPISDHLVRLNVRVVDQFGFYNARSICDVRRMDGTYFHRNWK